MNISELLGQEYLKQFTVVHWPTLFTPEWNNLAFSRCPFCNNKLVFTRNGKLAICKGLKHGKPFIIRGPKLQEIQTKLFMV